VFPRGHQAWITYASKTTSLQQRTTLLAWEKTEEEGKVTISAQRVHEFFQQFEYKIATEGAREDKKSRSGQTWVFQTNEQKQQENDTYNGVDVVY
jgi:hypothetical protein